MDTKYRYPGSRPFTEEHTDLFFGRDKDIKRLSTLVSVAESVVLYGKSGLGKSSLLNAGLLPLVEEEGYHLVIPIRLGAASEETEVHPLDILEEVLLGYTQGESIIPAEVERGTVTLWEMVRDIAAAHPDKQGILLVFDQFEELFTYAEGVDEFAEALGTVLYDRMPRSLDRALSLASRRTPELLTNEVWKAVRTPVDVDALISIRSDKMSLLERLSDEIPTILHTCYELEPLTREQAITAIEAPAAMEGDFVSPTFSYEPATLDKMLGFLTQDGKKPIESFQLQIFCEHAEQNVVLARADRHVEPEDLGDLEAVSEGYYDACVAKVARGGDERRIREFIEEGLIFEEKEIRVSLFEEQIQKRFGLTTEEIRKLVDSHLIRAEPHASGLLYELCHDTLVPPVLRAKERRKAKEAAEKTRVAERRARERRVRFRNRVAFLVGVPAVVATLGWVWSWRAHSDDLAVPGLEEAHRPPASATARALGSAVDASIVRELGQTRLHLKGVGEGVDTVVVHGSGDETDTFLVRVVPQRVRTLERLDSVVPAEAREGDTLCFRPRCALADPGAAARLVREYAGSELGRPAEDHDLVLTIPVGRKRGEPVRWQVGLNPVNLLADEDETPPDGLVHLARELEFTVADDDTLTFWQVPVEVRIYPPDRAGTITVPLGETVTRELSLQKRSTTEARSKMAFAGKVLVERGGRTVVSPDGALRWSRDAEGGWTLQALLDAGDTVLAHGTDSAATARFSADGSRVLLTSTTPPPTLGVPYTFTSYAQGNRVTLDVGRDGVVDTSFTLNDGEHYQLQNTGWADAVLEVRSTAPLGLVETTRFWWQEITEATQARAVRPVSDDGPGPWLYWVPWVDTVSGPNGTSSQVVLTAPVGGTRVLVHRGGGVAADTVFVDPLENVPISEAGALLEADGPLNAAYEYRLTNWETYEDGWSMYEIPPERALGTEYAVAGDDGRVITVLATRAGTRVEVLGERVDTLGRGERLTLTSGSETTRRIRSSHPVMVVVAGFDDDRHGATWAFVAPPPRDTLFHVPPVSTHHYPLPSDSSVLEITAVENATGVRCGNEPEVILSPEEVFRCPLRSSSGTKVRSSRPVAAVVHSRVTGSDTFTGDRRDYAYAHAQAGVSGGGTSFVLRPFDAAAAAGFQDASTELSVRRRDGGIDFSQILDGTVVDAIPVESGGFQVALRDRLERVRVYTLTDAVHPQPTLLGAAEEVWLSETGLHALSRNEDGNLHWHDLGKATADTIPCGSEAGGLDCAGWQALALGGRDALLLTVPEEGPAELWAIDCLRDRACRLLSGPVRAPEDFLPQDRSGLQAVTLSPEGRWARASHGGDVVAWDLNLEIPEEGWDDRALERLSSLVPWLWRTFSFVAGILLLYDLLSGASALEELRRRGERGERGLLARIGQGLR